MFLKKIFWFNTSAGSVDLLVPFICWFHWLAGSTDLLVPLTCWFHTPAGATFPHILKAMAPSSFAAF
jgi:hypothetical protein